MPTSDLHTNRNLTQTLCQRALDCRTDDGDTPKIVQQWRQDHVGCRPFHIPIYINDMHSQQCTYIFSPLRLSGPHTAFPFGMQEGAARRQGSASPGHSTATRIGGLLKLRLQKLTGSDRPASLLICSPPPGCSLRTAPNNQVQLVLSTCQAYKYKAYKSNGSTSP
jgi:hypothetical protein